MLLLLLLHVRVRDRCCCCLRKVHRPRELLAVLVEREKSKPLLPTRSLLLVSLLLRRGGLPRWQQRTLWALTTLHRSLVSRARASASREKDAHAPGAAGHASWPRCVATAAHILLFHARWV